MPVGADFEPSGRLPMPVNQHPLRSVLRSVDPKSCPTRLNFHCHSLCSDGSLSPCQIAEQAVEIGLEHLAVTDHHSADAWDPLQQRFSELSQAGHPVPTLWSGCEISCVLETCLVHVLALGYDRSHSAIAPYLQGDAVIGDQLEAEAVVEAIHASSGLAVLAHPARYRLGFKPLMHAAAALGFDGAECWYDYEMQPQWRPSPLICEHKAALASDLNLLQSCGTDSHGTSLKGR